MMKSIVALMLISTSAFAVRVSKCPRSLELAMPEVQTFSKSFVDRQTHDYYRVDRKSIANFLSGTYDSFYFQGELVDTRNSRCVYESTDFFNLFRLVRIAGTDKKPYLVMEFSDEEMETSLSLFASPTMKSPMYNFSGATVQIKAEAWGESWGDSYLVNISVGKTEIR